MSLKNFEQSLEVLISEIQKKGGVRNVGTSPAFLLFLVFMVLKLTGYIAWSWWIVTAPLWSPIVFVIVLLFVSAMIGDGRG